MQFSISLNCSFSEKQALYSQLAYIPAPQSVVGKKEATVTPEIVARGIDFISGG